ncbi:MAG TPA: 3-hydroxyacyl-ACP dehydratase FabZ [Micropepsaceae bacterium]|jgi:3-hydroxyacyl-[acyl-carrier-protein] dehydratase|nr:3-hydroxyacyl-ACP dehydratase FabZ [Micropepsaceae bacterium]
MDKKTDTPSTQTEIDVEHLKRLLPHRAPFLMVDRLTDIKHGESAVGWKAVSINEPHFGGHFPEYAVMPGVLIVEAMAQAAAAFVVHTLGLQDQRRMVYFMTIDKARFRRPVHPGVLLRLPVQVQRRRGPVWRFEGKAYVGEELCAEAEYSAMLTENSLGAARRAAPSAGVE